MKALIAIALVLGLAACADGPTNITGDANYDALKMASDKCKANGGKLVLKDQGDPQKLQAYVCKVT